MGGSYRLLEIDDVQLLPTRHPPIWARIGPTKIPTFFLTVWLGKADHIQMGGKLRLCGTLSPFDHVASVSAVSLFWSR